MNPTDHSESVNAKQSAARRAAKADVPIKLSTKTTDKGLHADEPAAKKAKPKANAKAKAQDKPQPRVAGEAVRKLMADLGLSGKDLATAGGFSLSRVAELRNIGEMPASWKGRDRHASATQWAAVEKAARALAAKSAAKRAPTAKKAKAA